MHSYPQTSVLIAGQIVAGHDARRALADVQAMLVTARQAHGHALCLCVKPHLKLQIRTRSNSMHLAAWPDEGNRHSSGCPFYSEHPRLNLAPSPAIRVDEDLASIQYAKPLAYQQRPGTKRPIPADQSQVSILGALHFLWERTGLNRWQPGWQRDWSYARFALLRASQTAEVNGVRLTDLLYVPRVYSESQRPTIKSEWSKFAKPLEANPRGSQSVQTGFVLGVVRRLETHAAGQLLFLQHHGLPILLPTGLLEKLNRSCRWALAAANNTASITPDTRVVALLQVACSRNGHFSAQDAALMRTNKKLIPANVNSEERLADLLVAQQREFVRPMSYHQYQIDLPSFVLKSRAAAGLLVTEMFCLARTSVPAIRAKQMAEQTQRAHESNHAVWFWDQSASTEMPDLPAAEKTST